ncbi:MBL fold metallo-hydrolase [Sneathiella chinensis]|uniref:MBL fold metallo-hydrolase n=1 Tax=Sneathiella chinensis TaxID=349750 RepID=A0ABQ5TZV2_9PROT|nr:MBL fold metallo-hydrolase [Sneathiella chinensis]GLQ05522.1 MBL fold metallo-hydrolase [Sneathiella chinensis]
MNVWQVGSVKITRIVEIEAAGGTRGLLPDATPEAVRDIDWLRPHFVTEDGKLIMSIHALVVDTGEHRIIVDTCIGNDKKRNVPAWNNLQTGFLNDLEQAGYRREDMDTVLCTHLHVDHVGWNTMLEDGAWVPTFPNARYLFAEREWKHWQSNRQDEYGDVIEDSVAPIVEADLATFVPSDYRVCDEVSLIPTPGHTPGHVSVRIRSQGQEALITGDFLHHPCQMAHTNWSSTADNDKAHASRTRRQVLTELAGTPTLCIGTHFATPTAGWVKQDDEGGFWLDVEPG